MSLRFNPPAGWPSPPDGFSPDAGWRPDPSWPPAPPGWQLWVDDGQPPIDAGPQEAGTALAGPAQEWAASAGPAQQWAAPAGPAQFTPAWQPGAPQQQWAPSQYGLSGQQRANGWAIASFILGVVGGTVLSVIFGIIALRQIRASGQRGRGLAIAGLALSAGWVLVIAAGVAFFALTGANRSPVTGLITQQGRLSVYSLLTGDCFDNSAGVKYVATVTAFPCTQPHNAQVYALFRLTGSDSQYPGRAAVVRLAVRGCTARVGSLDRAKVTSAMTVRYLYPQPLLWLDGRRAVTCMIVNPTPTLTSSVLKPAGPLG